MKKMSQIREKKEDMENDGQEMNSSSVLIYPFFQYEMKWSFKGSEVNGGIMDIL